MKTFKEIFAILETRPPRASVKITKKDAVQSKKQGEIESLDRKIGELENEVKILKDKRRKLARTWGIG
jgi:hypothetical protein